MDRQVLSEKERLAARISELENRLAAVKKAKLKVSHSDNNAQTYGDYVWLPEDATAMTSEDVDFATAEAHYNEMALGNPSGSSFPSFKYVLSPNERRKPNDLQAKSWAEVDGGNRVLTAYKSVFDLRKPGENVSDSDERKWTEVVGVNNENELSMFHDWQVKVFEKGNASNNASMTAQELSENISVWVGMEEEILGNANDKSNMDDLMEMVKLGEGKISKDLLSKANGMLNKMASVHNKIDPNHSKAAMKINKYMGMKGNFLQASLGRIRNQMDNIVGFKDVAFYVSEQEPTVDSKKLSIDDEVVGGNYIRLDRSKYAFNVQPATDEVDEESGFYKEDYEMGRMKGPIVNLNGDEVKNKTIWLRYTVVSELGEDVTVSEQVACEKPVEKTRALVYDGDVEKVKDEDGKEVIRMAKPKITTRDQVIYDLQQGCSPLNWYRPIAANIDFAHLHFQGRIPPGTDLTGADFTGSNLTGVVFDECILDGVNFKGCKILNTSFAGCSYDEHTIWPLGFGDITPDYFTISPDMGNGTAVLAKNQPWFPFSEYVHSDGVHDPSGNSEANSGTWTKESNSIYVQGAKHWEDLSGQEGGTNEGTTVNHVIYDSKLRSMGKVKTTKYIENSTSHRLTKGMIDLIYDANDVNGTRVFMNDRAKDATDLINVGGKLKSQSMIALFGMPPTFIDGTISGTSIDVEYKRGDPGVMQVDASKCYVMNDFFTRDSACSWEAGPVTVSALMTLMGKGNVSNIKKLENRVVPKSKKDLEEMKFEVKIGGELRKFSAYTLMYQYRHNLNIRTIYGEHNDGEKNDWSESVQNKMSLDSVEKISKNALKYNGPKELGDKKLFKKVPNSVADILNDTEAVDHLIVFPVRDMEKDMPDLDRPCPSMGDNLNYESLASSLPSNVPYNIIFNHINYEVFDKDKIIRADDGLLSTAEGNVEDIVSTTYIRPYPALVFTGGNRYGKKKNEAGAESEKEVQEFLNMAQFPSFGVVNKGGVAFIDGDEKDLEETLNGETFRVMNSIVDESRMDGVITNRFRKYPITNMVDANFEGCKFNWFEYNHGNSEHPDSNTLPTTKSLDKIESRSFVYATVFANAKLHRANFKKADLKRCVFYNCELYGTDFTEADIRGVIFKDCKYVPTSKDIEKDEKLRDVVANFTKVLGTDESLKGTNNVDIDNMKEAECVETRGFRNVRFFNSLPWDEIYAIGNGFQVDLEDLSCNFTEAKLYGAEFAGVEIGGDLSGVEIRGGLFNNVRIVGERKGMNDKKGVKLHNLDVRYSLFQNYTVEDGVKTNDYDPILKISEVPLDFKEGESFILPPQLTRLDIEGVDDEPAEPTSTPDTLEAYFEQQFNSAKSKGERFSEDKKDIVKELENNINQKLFIDGELAKVMMSHFKKMQVSAQREINEINKGENNTQASDAIKSTLKVNTELSKKMLDLIKKKLEFPLGVTLINLCTKVNQEPTLLDRAKAGDKELSNSDWTPYVSQNPIINIDLENACIDNSTLSGIQFIGAKLAGTQFNDCSLNNIQLYDCDMYQTNFSKSWMENADISGGEKEPTNLKNTLMEANFSNTDLKDAKFYNVLVSKTDFRSSFNDGKRKEALYKDHVKWNGTWINDTHFLRLWVHKNMELEETSDKTVGEGGPLSYATSVGEGKRQCELARKREKGGIELLGETNQGVEAIPNEQGVKQNPNWSFYAPKFPTGFEYSVRDTVGKVLYTTTSKFIDATDITRDGPTIFEQMDAKYFTSLESNVPPEHSKNYLTDISGVKIENLSDIGSGNQRSMVFTKIKFPIEKQINGTVALIAPTSSETYRIKRKPQIFWRKKVDVYGKEIKVDAEDIEVGSLPQYESLNATNSIIKNVVFDRLVLPGAKFVGAVGTGRKGNITSNTQGTSFVNIQSWYRREIFDKSPPVALTVPEGGAGVIDDGIIDWKKMGVLGQIPYGSNYKNGTEVNDCVKAYLEENAPVVLSSTGEKFFKQLSAKNFETNDAAEEELLKAVSIDFSGVVLGEGGFGTGTDISRVYFNGAYIPYSNFTNAKLQRCVFGASNLPGNLPEGVNNTFEQNKRDDIETGKYKTINNLCILTGSIFKNADLSGTSFYRAVIDKCDFTNNKSLRKVIVNGVDTNDGLSFQSLESAKGIILNGADLSGCVIGSGNSKQPLNMANCQIQKTNLIGATFNSVQFNNAKFGEKEFPMSLENTVFNDIDTKLADFKYSKFKNTRFIGINNKIQEYTEDPQDLILGTKWPVGYYRTVRADTSEKTLIFNFPSTLHSEGFTYRLGADRGTSDYLQAPKPDSMLKYGIIKIREALLDTNIIDYNPDNIDKKHFSDLQVDYQAPNHYAFYKKDDIMADGGKAKGGQPKFSLVYVNTKGEVVSKVRKAISSSVKTLFTRGWINEDEQNIIETNPDDFSGLNNREKATAALGLLPLLDKSEAEEQITKNKNSDVNNSEKVAFRTYMFWIEEEWLYQEKMRLLSVEKQMPYVQNHWADIDETTNKVYHKMGGSVEMNKEKDRWHPDLKMMHRKPLVLYKQFQTGEERKRFEDFLNNSLKFTIDGDTQKIKFEDWEKGQVELASLTEKSDLFNRKATLDEIMVEPILINSRKSLAKNIKISGSSVYGIDFTSSDFSSTTFLRTTFYKCIFDKCVMKNMDIDDCYFECCSFVSSDFSELSETNGNTEIKRTSFLNCDFYGSNFKLTHLNDIKTSGCSFDVANFELAYLENLAVCRVPKYGQKFYEIKKRVEFYNDIDDLFNDLCERGLINEDAIYEPGEQKNLDEARKYFNEVIKSNFSTLVESEQTSKLNQLWDEDTWKQYETPSNPPKVLDEYANLEDLNKIEKYWWSLIQREYWDEQVNKISIELQTKQKNYIWQTAPVRLGATKKNSEYKNEIIKIKNKMKTRRNGIATMSELFNSFPDEAPYHSDFREAIFKETLFNNFSLDGNTEDLHGLNPNLVPDGFLNKLWNNKLNAGGDSEPSDASGNIQIAFERSSQWSENLQQSVNSYILGGVKATLPSIESEWGIWELSHNFVFVNTDTRTWFIEGEDENDKRKIHDAELAKNTYGITLPTVWKKIEDAAEILKGPGEVDAVVQYHKPLSQGWYPVKDNTTVLNTNSGWSAAGQQESLAADYHNNIYTASSVNSNSYGDLTTSFLKLDKKTASKIAIKYARNTSATAGVDATGVDLNTNNGYNHLTIGYIRTNNVGFDKGTDLSGNGASRIDGPSFRDRLLAHSRAYKEGRVARRINIAGVSRESKNISRVGLDGGSTLGYRLQMQELILCESDFSTSEYFTIHPNPQINLQASKTNSDVIKNGYTQVKNPKTYGTSVNWDLADSSELYKSGYEAGLQLVFADLTGSNFAGCDLTNVNFEGAILKDVNFDSAKLVGANLRGADLTGATFINTDVRDMMVGYSELSMTHTVFRNDGLTPLSEINDSSEHYPENALEGRYKNKEALFWKISEGDGTLGATGSSTVSQIYLWSNNTSYWPYGMSNTELIGSKIGGVVVGRSVGEGALSDPLTIGDNSLYYETGSMVESTFNRENINNNQSIQKLVNSSHIDLLRSGKPLLGGLNFSKSLIPDRGTGTATYDKTVDISYTEIDTTNSIFFTILSRLSQLSSTKIGLTYDNKLETINLGDWLGSFSKLDKKINYNTETNYDTIFDVDYEKQSTNWNSLRDDEEFSYINRTDLRRYYIDHIRKIREVRKKNTKGFSHLMQLNLPPNAIVKIKNKKTGGEMFNSEKLSTMTDDEIDTLWDPNKYPVLQPRYDFSTPNKLKEDESRTIFDGCDLSHCLLPYSNFINVSAVNTKFNAGLLRGCDFTNANLEGADFSFAVKGPKGDAQRTDLVKTKFVNANLKNAKFLLANVAYCDFSGANIEGCVFYGANIANADFRYANFGAGANFVGAGPWYDVGPDNDSTLYNGSVIPDGTPQIEFRQFAKDSSKFEKNFKIGEYWTLNKQDIYEDEFDYTKLHEKQTLIKNTEEMNKWTFFNKDNLGDDVDKLFDQATMVGSQRRSGLYRFSFTDEALSQDKTSLYHEVGKKLLNTDSPQSKRILAHKDFLLNVLPKFPKGFNTMAALGWERDASGIIIPHFRRGFLFSASSKISSIDTPVAATKNELVINNLLIGEDAHGNNYPSPPDAGYEDYRVMGVYGGKQQGHDSIDYYDPMARYAAQNYNPANVDGANILNVSSFEHGYGLNNAPKDAYMKLQTQLSCTKFETLNEPILNGPKEDLSGIVFNKDHNPATTATFKNCNFLEGYPNGMRFKQCDLSGVSFENALFPNSVDEEKRLEFHDCSMNAMNFNNAKLQNSVFKDDVKLKGTTFHGADLTGASFKGVDLDGVEFTNVPVFANIDTEHKDAVITNVDFEGCKNPHLAKWPLGTDISSIVGLGETVNKGDLITVYEMIQLGRKNFNKTTFTQNLLEKHYENGKEPKVDFSGCQMHECVFDKGDGSDYLNGVDFSGADLQDCDFRGVNLTGAKFTDYTRFKRTRFVGATKANKASWPTGFIYPLAVQAAEDDDLMKYYLGRNAVDEKSNYTINTKLPISLWYDNSMNDISSALTGPLAVKYASEMNVKGTFSLHDLSSNNPTIFEQAIGFPPHKIGGIYDGRAQNSKIPDGAVKDEGLAQVWPNIVNSENNKVIAPTVDNSGIFVNQNLQHLDFSRETFHNGGTIVYDFSGAKIQGSQFIYADLSGVDFKNCVYRDNNGLYHGDVKNCDFTGANLTNADFSGCDIDGCSFVYATINNTNFKHTKNSDNAYFPEGFDFIWDHRDSNDYWESGGNAGNAVPNSTYDYTNKDIAVREILGALTGYPNQSKNANDPKREKIKEKIGKKYVSIPVSDGNGGQTFLANPSVDSTDTLMKSNWVQSLRDSNAKIVSNKPQSGGLGKNRIITGGIATGKKYDYTSNMWKNQELGNQGWSTAYNLLNFVDLSNNVNADGKIINNNNVIITDHELFKEACFSEGNFVQTSFRNTSLEHVDFSGADLSGADLSGATLFPTDWRVDSKTANEEDLVGGINFRNATLIHPTESNATLDKDIFENIKRLDVGSGQRSEGYENWWLATTGYSNTFTLKAMGNIDFTNVIFNNGNMGAESVDLKECYLPWSKFTNADLSGVDFSGSDLTGCDFRGANLTAVNFEFATIKDCDFRGAILKNTVATNAVWNAKTEEQMPKGFEPSQVNLRINKDRKNIEMWTGTKVDSTTKGIMSDFQYGTYTNGRYNITTVPATFGYSVKESIRRLIAGSKADKNNAKADMELTGELKDGGLALGHWNNGNQGWQLESANQSSTASHIGDDLSGTNFQDTTVFGAPTLRTGGCTNTQVDLSKADLSGSNLMEVNLQYANLYGANLSKVDLSGTDFYNADMTKAKLHEVDSRQNTGSKVNTIDGKPVPSEYLWPKCMEEVDISASDFSGVVFTVSTDMSGAVIVDSSFNNVIADKINLSYAKIGSTSVGAVHKTTFEKACFTGVCSFERADISNVDLSGAQMAGHNYDYAKLENLNFVDIKNASLGQATFRYATIKNCDLSGTASSKFTWDGNAQHATFIDLSFTHVDLNNCDNVDLSSATFQNVQFTSCDLKTANFSGVDLRNVSLVGNELKGINLKDANISNSNLSGADLGEADLSGTNLVGTNLDSVNVSLVNTNKNGAKADGMTKYQKKNGSQMPYLLRNDLSGSSLTNIAFGEFIFLNCDLTNVDFNGSDLSNVQFANCNMTHDYTSDASANLQSAINTALSQHGKGMTFENSTLWPKTFQTINDISSVVINGISSVGLDLSNTLLSLSADDDAHKLHKADLVGLDLSGSTMRHANIEDCSLNGAVLTGTDLSNAKISNSILIGASIDHTTDLHNAKLTNLDLSGASLVGADISSATLNNINLFASDLAGTKIKLSNAVLSVSSFGRANLGSSTVALDLSGANLRGVSFVDASLNNVDFTNADLSGVDFRQLNEVGSSLTDLAARSQMIKDTLHSVVGAKLEHVKLTDLSLVDIDLSGVHGGVLNNIDFSNCNLTGAMFKGLQITDCNFTDASLNSASFEECTFTGKNVFDRTDISGMDVSGANMLNVKLSGGGYYYQQMDASLNNPFSNPKGQPVVYPYTSLAAVGIDNIVNLDKATKLNGLSLAGFTFTEKELDLSGADLSGINMTNVVANGLLGKTIDFSGCNLKNSDLTGCDLSGARFNYANLENVKFNNASLHHCDFSGANVKGADFTEADLSGSIFLNTNISETNFYKVQNAPDVSGVDLHRVYTSVDGSIPDEDVVRDTYPVNSHLSISFRKANVGVIKDASGNNFAVNSVGHTGNDGVPEKNINPLNTTLFTKYKY